MVFGIETTHSHSLDRAVSRPPVQRSYLLAGLLPRLCLECLVVKASACARPLATINYAIEQIYIHTTVAQHRKRGIARVSCRSEWINFSAVGASLCAVELYGCIGGCHRMDRTRRCRNALCLAVLQHLPRNLLFANILERMSHSLSV